MKKMRIVLIITLLMLLPLMSGCGSEDNDVVEILERFFVRQMMDITQNLDNYTGRTIQLEGMFWSAHNHYTDESFYFVVRFLSGCCGGGGTVGFEVDLGYLLPLPDDTWVEVTGVLEVRDTWQPGNPVLVITSIQELEVRGQEIVFL